MGGLLIDRSLPYIPRFPHRRPECENLENSISIDRSNVKKKDGERFTAAKQLILQLIFEKK
jgi:hypothetical protein